MRLPAFHGKSLTGQSVALTFDRNGPYTILLVYSPVCGFCAKNWPQWDRILQAADDRRLRVVGVDLSGDSHQEYIEAHHLQRTLLLKQVDPQTLVDYRLRATPHTIVLDPVGTVVGSWVGVLHDDSLREILSLIRT